MRQIHALLGSLDVSE